MRGPHFDPGRLRHPVVLEQPLRVADDLGGHEEMWQVVASLWALLEPAAAIVDRAGAEEAEITHRVTLRFDARIKRGWRLVLGERIFTIRAMRDLDETGRYLLCLTREETP